MSFGRLDGLRASFHGGSSEGGGGGGNGRRGRPLLTLRRGSAHPESPLASPLTMRRKIHPQQSLDLGDLSGCVSGPPSLASSRESSLDRSNGHWGRAAAAAMAENRSTSPLSSPSSPGARLYNLVERVRASPKLKLRQRLQVMRSGSFNDVSAEGTSVATEGGRRKRWLLGRSESLRYPSSSSTSDLAEFRRGSLPPPPPPPATDAHHSPVRERSLDRVTRMERKAAPGLHHSRSLRVHPGHQRFSDQEDRTGEDATRVKGFVNR